MTLANENIADVDIEESVNNRLTTADSFTTASQVSQQLDNSFFNVYKRWFVCRVGRDGSSHVGSTLLFWEQK